MWIECNGSIYVKKGDIFYNSHRFLFMFLVNKYKIQQTNLAQINSYWIFASNNFQKIYEWWETIKQKISFVNIIQIVDIISLCLY